MFDFWIVNTFNACSPSFKHLLQLVPCSLRWIFPVSAQIAPVWMHLGFFLNKLYFVLGTYAALCTNCLINLSFFAEMCFISRCLCCLKAFVYTARRYHILNHSRCRLKLNPILIFYMFACLIFWAKFSSLGCELDLIFFKRFFCFCKKKNTPIM